MSEDLKEFLHRHGIKNPSPAFQKLMEYGVTEVAEISLLTEEDLRKAGRYCAVKILPADCIILKISQNCVLQIKFSNLFRHTCCTILFFSIGLD